MQREKEKVHSDPRGNSFKKALSAPSMLTSPDKTI